MILAAVRFYLDGTMTLANALMSVIISFLVFAQIESAGSGMAILRMAGSAIDRVEQMDEIPQMGEGGRPIQPERHDICFDDVHFSYGEKRSCVGFPR